ncbi:hypothetical protein T07_6076 [Trichinella nelsoni]|uniref:Uncharacterized protein n=1 Tax=Trichinella nelsoni TaxID=6336 RepID=A0A0V0SAX5_9BILA|nr:hypothetical protein T07_6076 [Trichinella nelsoni]
MKMGGRKVNAGGNGPDENNKAETEPLTVTENPLQTEACPGTGSSTFPAAVQPTCWRPPVLFSSGTEPNRWIASLEIFFRVSGLPRCQWAVTALNHMDSAIQERLTASIDRTM